MNGRQATRGPGHDAPEPSEPRVVVLTPMVTRSNGGSSTALDIADGLHSLGVETDVVLTQDSPWQYRLSRARRGLTSLPGSRLHCLDFERATSPHPTARRDRSAQRLAQRARQWLLACNRRTTARRTRRVLAEATVVIDAGVGIGDRVAAVRALAPRARLVMNHNGSVEAFEAHFLASEPAAESVRAGYVRYLGGYDVLMFQSSDVAADVVSIVPGFAAKHLVVSPSCQEPQILAARRQRTPFAPGQVSVVVVGSVQRRKGQDDAVRALALLRRSGAVTLHFVGPVVDAEYGEGIRRLADDLGVASSVVTHGLRADYARFLAHATVVLQPSSAEGVSRILREAMLLQRPIVAYSIPGTSSVLADGVDALLVPRGDVDALATALGRVIDEQGLAERLGAAAGATYLRNHAWAVFLLGLCDLIEATHAASAPEPAA